MKRHSDKAFYNAVVKELQQEKFTDKNGNILSFSHWYYEKGKINLFFKYEQIKDKLSGIQLYYQHLNDYKNSLSLIYHCFDKVEKLETLRNL
jgi:hypothetical protein